MVTTIVLTILMCALLFMMVWAAVYLFPSRKLMRFFSQDIRRKTMRHKPPFAAAPLIGWMVMGICVAGFLAVLLYAGWDGIRMEYIFGQFFVRYLIILLGVKVFDLIFLDFFLITRTHFFQFYLPETRGCKGYRRFGYNARQQLIQTIAMPLLSLLFAFLCTLF